MKNENGKKPLSNSELSAFCGQMALILSSGISASEGLSVLCEDARDDEEKEILESLLRDMEQTGDLAGAMEQSGVFPNYAAQMTRIGETTGHLDDVMNSLSRHYDREESIGRSIRSAVTYPAVMTVMMILVILVLLTRVMPIFQQVFIQLGSEMTSLARGLMELGQGISRYSAVITAILLALIALILLAVCTEKGRKASLRLGYKISGTRRILEETAGCRFADGMALILSSGLTSEEGMEMTARLNEDPVFALRLEDCSRRIDEGADLAQALKESGIFTGVYARMVSVGGKTGNMDQVMARIAEMYEDDIDARISDTLSTLEPSFVIVLSLIVGVILLSVMLPLMGILSGI